MLIEFSVKNFRSIKDKVTLSMNIAESDKKFLDRNTIKTDNKTVPHLSKIAGIYGPNAAGKTNFVRGALYSKLLLLTYNDRFFHAEPFVLDVLSPSQPSEFEWVFLQDDNIYQYGFAMNQERFTKEYLYVYPKATGRQQKWFERHYDEITKSDIYDFSVTHFKGPREQWKQLTGPQVLFVKIAHKFHENESLLKPVLNWFEKKLFVIDAVMANNLEFVTESGKYSQSERGQKEAIKFFNDLDIHVKQIQYDQVSNTVYFLYQIPDTDRMIPIDLGSQSLGTIKLFCYLERWDALVHHDITLFVDELDSSLHSNLFQSLILKFLKNSEKEGQLIFNCHNPSLLNKEVFRRDQVWFVEKDQNESSTLYSLAEFKKKPRAEEAFEKRYLAGAYGAVPYLPDLLDEQDV